MPLPSILESCKSDLLTPDEELLAKYPAAMAERIMRIREMYNHWLSNPTMKDRDLVAEIRRRFGISQSSAYSDLTVIRQIVPLLSQKSRDYHRALANEMLMETYRTAKENGDTRSMSAAAAHYAKYNRVDAEDEMSMPYDDIVPQNFSATLDPSVLGIKPIPGIYDYIDRLNKDLARDYADIDDVEFEEVDLEENFLFAPLSNERTDTQGQP